MEIAPPPVLRLFAAVVEKKLIPAPWVAAL